MTLSHGSRIGASAFAVALALGSVGMTHAAADPTAFAAKPDPIVIVNTDLQVRFLSRGPGNNTRVDLYEVKNVGFAPAENVALEQVCIFKAYRGGPISTRTSTVKLGTLNGGSQIDPSVTCTAPAGSYVQGSTLKATTSSPETDTSNNHAASN